MSQKNNNDKKTTVIDAQGLVLGRMGSIIAKRLLLGENITVVNCKGAVLVGKKELILKKYQDKRNNKVVKQGPYFHRNAGDIVKRSLRNMLPYKNFRGREALNRLRCYACVPKSLIETKKEVLETCKVNFDRTFYYTQVGEISKLLGYNENGKK